MMKLLTGGFFLLFTAGILEAQTLKELPAAYLIGPYLHLTSDPPVPPQMVLRWVTSPGIPGEVEYGPTKALGKKYQSPDSGYQSFFLPMETGNFFYRVKGPQGWTPIYQTQIKKPGSRSAALIMADAQDAEMKPPRRWAEVAQKALEKAREIDADFVVFLGDLVEDDYPGYWKLFFDRSGDLFKTYPLMVVPGNHDSSPERAQRGKLLRYLDYFPGSLYGALEWGPWAWMLLNTEVTAQGNLEEDENQTGFAKSFYERNQSRPWVLTGFHLPPWHALDRHQNTMELTRGFASLWEGGSDLVLSGHVHAYQRTRPIRLETGIQETYGRKPNQGVGYVVLPPAGNWPEPYRRIDRDSEEAQALVWPQISGSWPPSEIGFITAVAQEKTLTFEVWGLGDLQTLRDTPLHRVDQFQLKK